MTSSKPVPPASIWPARLRLAAIAASAVALVWSAADGGAAAEVAFGYVVFACLVVWAWHLCQQDGVRLGDVVGGLPSDRRDWAWAGLAIPLMAFELAMMLSIYYLVSLVAPGYVERELLAPDDPSPLVGRPLLTGLDAAASVVFGPVAEEVFFRGALLHSWSRRWGARHGLVASALVFGALHADPFGAVFFAVCMTLLYRRTGTLLVPIACHALHNAIVTASELIDSAEPAAETLAEFQGDGWWIALALPLAAGVLAVIVRRLRARPVLVGLA